MNVLSSRFIITCLIPIHYDFFLQNRILRHSVEDNIIISNYSLVLQDVKRSSSGVYMCVGSNVEGDADSNPIFLDVKCE